VAYVQELLCNHRFGRRLNAQAVVDAWVAGKIFMLPTMDSIKRGLILSFLAVMVIWLFWCGRQFNENNYTLFPAVMCAAECVLLILTAAAILRRNVEGEVDE